MAGLPRTLRAISQRLYRGYKAVRCFYQDSPLAFGLTILAIVLVILTVSLFSIAVARYIGARGTVLVDLSLLWLFARLVARVLLFPGSLKLFQRNTEATFRNEMARQYVHFLRQLWTFLRHAAKQSEHMLRGVNADGILRGCMVLETLSESFSMQKQLHEVTLSAEQTQMHAAAQDIDYWLKGAKVRMRRREGVGRGQRDPGPGSGAAAEPQPLIDWVRHQAAYAQAAYAAVGSAAFGAGMGSLQALMCAELAGDLEEAAQNIAKVEQLLVMLDDLRHQNKSMFRTALRFFRVPTVGSLNQLRTELQMKFSGHRCWVPTRRGHRLDCMFIPCDMNKGTSNDEAHTEDTPLKASNRPPTLSGPTIVWCNPNAAYYETMVYQPTWLNFWLSQGCNIFFFNYAGYGQSTGSPSPARIAEDGDCVIKFLKGKGITQIGIYGRSIGGVTACHLARRHPDMVQLLVADRTMSTLQGAARHLYGSWAAKGLQVTNMMADNVENFWEVRCYKLLIVDPKDAMILDPAALRTGVAMRVIERLPPEERLAVDDERLMALAEVWHFFGHLFAICEGEDDAGLEETMSRSARQPSFARDDHKDVRVKVGENGNEAGSRGGASGESVSTQWLAENAGIVRQTMAPFADQVRSALDVVGEHLEGSGISINDVFLDNPSEPIWPLKSMLANIQVWGTLGEQREDGEQLGHLDPPGGAGGPPAEGSEDGASRYEKEIECFLRKEFSGEFLQYRELNEQQLAELGAHLEKLGRMLRPEMLAAYHRRLSRLRVAQVRREFRRRVGSLQHAFEHTGPPGGSGASASSSGGDFAPHDQAERLRLSVLARLTEVERFIATLGRFFKTVDLSLPYSRQQDQQVPSARSSSKDAPDASPMNSDSSDEKSFDQGTGRAAACDVPAVTPQPAVDHSAAGYLMHVDCGHNGALDEVDMRQLALHLRSARFGQFGQAS